MKRQHNFTTASIKDGFNFNQSIWKKPVQEEKKTEKTFSEMLFSYIAARNEKNSYWYQRACISPSLFSDMKIKTYTPKFKNAIKIALALNLSLNEINDLLARARLTLSPCFTLDAVVKQFLENPKYYNPKQYDLIKLDILLSDAGEEPIFNDESD
jgi:hypothetical protein